MRIRKFPPGWNQEGVQEVLTRYEAQSEDEAAFEAPTETVMPSSRLSAKPSNASQCAKPMAR